MERLKELHNIFGQKMSTNMQYKNYTHEEIELFNEKLKGFEIRVINYYIANMLKDIRGFVRLRDLITNITKINKKRCNFDTKVHILEKMFKKYGMDFEQARLRFGLLDGSPFYLFKVFY